MVPWGVHIATLDLESASVVVPPEPVSQRTTIGEQEPRWAPDGRQLVYIRRRGYGNRSISIYDVSTKSARDIMPELKSLAWPCFSPDGQRIAVVGRGRYNQVGIYQVDAASGNATLIHGCGGVGKPEWFPDGKSLLYSRLEKGETRVGRVDRLDLVPGEEKQLASIIGKGAPRVPLHTALSPEGGRIAFTGYEQETRSWVLKILALGTGDTRPLHRINVREFPSGLTWTPDGTQLLLGTIHSLYSIPAGGGEVRKIDLNVEWCGHPTMHPDGRRLAFATYVEPLTYEIRMLENRLAPLDAPGHPEE